MSFVRGIALTLVASGVLGCTSSPAGWDLGELEDRHPAVEAIADHRLEEALPYFALSQDGLGLFFCRWSAQAPIPVWFPPEATPEQTAVFETALTAWEGAGLGIRFESQAWQGEPPRSGIVFELIDPLTDRAASAANTIADCAIPVEVAQPSDEAPGSSVDAELQYASIQLTTRRLDLIGRPLSLSSTELLGAAVHELGHALGFPGHVARGPSVMSAHGQMDAARRWGKRIEAGETLEAPTLAALYAVPSGARVGFLPLTRAQLDPIRELSDVATRVAMSGPYGRVGETSARIFWRDETGRSAAVIVLDWAATLRDPARLDPRFNRRARVLVETALR
jgi:hypothetical protein